MARPQTGPTIPTQELGGPEVVTTRVVANMFGYLLGPLAKDGEGSYAKNRSASNAVLCRLEQEALEGAAWEYPRPRCVPEIFLDPKSTLR